MSYKPSHTGLEVGLDGFTDSGIEGSRNRSRASHAGRAENLPVLKDLMTDSTQLPSSACPTPLHSPLFGATGASGRVHHHGSGEPMLAIDLQGKVGPAHGSSDDDDGTKSEAIVSHLELDIGKEMDGFNERLLLAGSKVDSGKT